MLKLIALLLLGFWATPCLALPTPTQVTAALYQQIPDFPKGEVNQDGTQNLIRRLVTYHNFLKNRSPYSRFDWKLTVADYIGYNDPIRAEEYPGREELPVNPYLADQRLMDQLTRPEREALISTLLKIYRENPG